MIDLIRWDNLAAKDSPWFSYMLCKETEIDDLVATGRANRDREIRVVRGRRCASKKGLLQEFAAALQFPWYFGENWDAFDECMTDLSWLRGPTVIVIMTCCDRVLEDEPERDLVVLLHSLSSAVGAFPAPIPGNPPLPRDVETLRVVLHSETTRQEAFLSRFGDLSDLEHRWSKWK